MGNWVYVRNNKTKAHQPGIWNKTKHTEAVMTWLATGNLVQTAAITKIPLPTLKHWKKQPWWKEAVDTFYDDDKQELDAKYQKIVRKALTVMDDRLTNGNFQMDQKTGRILRVPVSLADSHRVMKDLVDQQQVLRKDKKEEQQQAQVSANETLLKLAKQFADMAKGKMMKDVTPGTTYDMEMEAEQILQNRLEASGASEISSDDTAPTPT